MSQHSEQIIDNIAFEEAKKSMQHKFPKIMGYFFEDTTSYIDTINQGLAQQDASLIMPAAHTIKSSSRQLGGAKLSDVAALLEQKAREYMKEETDFSVMQQLAVELKELFQITKEQMENRI